MMIRMHCFSVVVRMDDRSLTSLITGFSSDSDLCSCHRACMSACVYWNVGGAWLAILTWTVHTLGIPVLSNASLYKITFQEIVHFFHCLQLLYGMPDCMVSHELALGLFIGECCWHTQYSRRDIVSQTHTLLWAGRMYICASYNTSRCVCVCMYM
jgi:hypothetical protein